MNADVILQVMAVILQFAQFGQFFVGGGGGEAFKEHIPTLLVTLPKVALKKRLAQNGLAVHNHIVNLPQ